MARDQLEELKDRHWAVLSFYSPDQAEEKVTEALNEFQQLEPAARLNDFNGSNGVSSSSENAVIENAKVESEGTITNEGQS